LFAKVREEWIQIWLGELAARFQAARNDHTDTTDRATHDLLEPQSDAIFTRLEQ